MFKRSKRSAPQPFNKSLTGIYFLLAGLTVVLIPHVFHLPIWATLCCFALLIWRLLYDRGLIPLPNKLIIFVLFVLIVLGVIVSYKTIVGRQAGTAMLISLLCLKLFEIKSVRDISVIVQLAFFSIVVTFLFSQTLFVAAAMLIAVLLLTSALISFQLAKTGGNRIIVPAKQRLFSAAKMMLYAIPLTVIIFILFPRTNAPLWGLPADAFQSSSGLSNRMSPGRISRLSESREVAFRVSFSLNKPPPGKSYWRGPVFDIFDGTGWTASKIKPHDLNSLPLNATANSVEYTVTLEPHNNKWLFALDMPDNAPVFAQLTSEMQLVSHKPVHHVTRYTLTSHLDYTLEWSDEQNITQYLHVPPNSSPRARQFIHQLIQRYPNKNDLINSVLEHFRTQQFFYTRQPPLLLNDPIDEFLFETRRGYCEHYASTFTVLMRLAGIPARVVTGYQGGEMNPLSDYMIVRQSDAHAWAEVYLEQQGWKRIDPTAVIPVANIENVADAARLHSSSTTALNLIEYDWLSSAVRRARFAWDMVNNSWNQWVIGYTKQKQKSFFKSLGIPEITWKGLSYLLFIFTSLFILIISINLILSQRIKKKKIDQLYLKFLKKFRKYKIYKQVNEGAYDFAKRITKLFPDNKTELFIIAKLYNHIRYSAPEPEKYNLLRQKIKSLRLKV